MSLLIFDVVNVVVVVVVDDEGLYGHVGCVRAVLNVRSVYSYVSFIKFMICFFVHTLRCTIAVNSSVIRLLVRTRFTAAGTVIVIG